MARAADLLGQIPVDAFTVLCWFVWPFVTLFALARVARGVARAGFLGVAARAVGGAVAHVAAGFVLAVAMLPAVDRQVIPACVEAGVERCAEQDGAALFPCGGSRDVQTEWCEEEDLTLVIPLVAGVLLAGFWLVALTVMKLAVAAWRRLRGRSA